MFTFEDVIHKNLILPDYVRDFIETPHFVRLKKLKQLGVTNCCFENAIHSRFEHSIGTAFLCQRILETIELNSSIKIAEIHKKCVILGGLLHDLGHGPFSHLWENCVHEGSDKNWTHEDQSVQMIRHMIDFAHISLNDDQKVHEYAVELISSLITGDCKAWHRLLKPSEMYLTEIVSNKFCNIDVDKCDYLLRDSFHVGRKIEPFEDFFNTARVVTYDDGISHIAYHAEDFHLIENMFKNRASYHVNVYQLAEVAGVEKQLLDICLLASAAGLKVDQFHITEIQKNCQAYLKLDDTILDLIRASDIESKLMLHAQNLLQRMEEKEFYTFVHESFTDCSVVFNNLMRKFGDIFVTFRKRIPNASIPMNIPLYDDDNSIVKKVSDTKLNYESTLIFCKAFDDTVVGDVQEYISNIKNNNF